MVTFLYNGRTYKAQDFQKKLKKLKITENDVEIIPNEHEIEREKKIAALPTESWHDVKLYHFKNTKTNETIVSIYNHLNNLPIKKDDWIRIEGNL